MGIFSKDTLQNGIKVMPKKGKIKIPPIVKTPEQGSTTEICSLSKNISVPSPKPSPSPKPKLTTQIFNDKPLDKFRASITTFKGFTSTGPDQEFKNATWDEIKNLVCSNIPAVLSDKKQGIYFVPCELQEAPLVGNTLEKAKKNGTLLVGKMRSKSHVTESSLLVTDVDGLPEQVVKTAIEKMKTDGITFLTYTTYSHGSADKPGDRLRVIVPLDRTVSVDEYSEVWRGIDKLYFDGQVGKADSSGSNMYQQQGTWCCHPDRRDQAKSQFHNAGVAKADYLIKKGHIIQVPKIVEPDTKKSDTRKTPTPSKFSAKNIENFNTANQGINRTYPISDANKIADDCKQIGKFRESRGKGQNEPLWRDCLGVVGYCENGVELCHDWSSGHSGYNKTETEKKILYRMQVAPTTCNQLRKINPGGCIGCTQTCHSPITLGWEKENPLAAMQQQFALIKAGGKLYMVDGKSLNERSSQGVAKNLELFDLKTSRMVIGRAVVEQYPGANVSQVINDFMYSPQTVCFEGIEFNPKETSGNYLNLWVGPTINPRQGTWGLIEDFLLKVICNGDKAAYEYLINFINTPCNDLKKSQG